MGYRIKIRAICGPTESESKVGRAILNILSLEREPPFKVHRLTGIFGEPLTILEAEISDDVAERVARHLIESVSDEYILERVERSGSAETIHLRLNKQLAYLGIIQPSEVDAIKIEIISRK
ncbi:MAG: RNA-binding domain-containing protein [Nitrososphaerota archaeon]